MLKHDLIPPPSFHLYPLGVDGSSVVYPEERETLPLVLQLNYEITIQAIRLGLLAAEFRSDITFTTGDAMQMSMTIKLRQTRIAHIQESLRHLWNVPAIQDLSQMQLATRVERLFRQAWMLYRGCIIYSHVSMWSGQRLDTSPDFDGELLIAAQQITQVAENCMDDSMQSTGYLVFPLFMAGFASTDGAQKMGVLDLLQKVQKDSLGHNAQHAREALSAIYDRQHERFLMSGQSWDIDWMHVVKEKGITMVHFGC